MKKFLVLINICWLLHPISAKNYDFQLVYEWKQIEYQFESEQDRTEAIRNGSFTVGKVQPIDAQYTYDVLTGRERIFITAPRLTAKGYPATLGVVTENRRDGNPVITPYPSWSWHIEPEKCHSNRIISVFRTWADECNRLWVMDTGILGEEYACKPQILLFDLSSDKLLHKYELPYDQYLNVSWYIAPITEIVGKCEDAWVYVADSNGPSMLVYNLRQDTSWRIQDRSFDPNPAYTSYVIDGQNFSLSDGLFTVALSPDKKRLHYHAMNDDKESWVYVNDLKKRSNFAKPYGSPQLFHTYSTRRNQQSATEASDCKGNLYFSLLIDVQLVKWNSGTAYEEKNFQVIASNKETQQFPSGLKVVPYQGNKRREVLWMFSVAYQRFATGTLNGNRTNFRLFKANL